MTHEKLVELTILAVTASANSVAAASIWILKRELKLQTKAFTDEYAWQRQELSIIIGSCRSGMSQRAFTVITLSVTFARSMGTPLVIATFHTRSPTMKAKPFTTMGQKMMSSVQCEMT